MLLEDFSLLCVRDAETTDIAVLYIQIYTPLTNSENMKELKIVILRAILTNI